MHKIANPLILKSGYLMLPWKLISESSNLSKKSNHTTASSLNTFFN